MMTYEAPVNGGTLAFHCFDLNFWFHNVDMPQINIATGGDANAHRIQDQMAGALLSLARNGTPSTDELPWPAFTTEGREFMIFDVESGHVNLDDAAFNEIFHN